MYEGRSEPQSLLVASRHERMGQKIDTTLLPDWVLVGKKGRYYLGRIFPYSLHIPSKLLGCIFLGTTAGNHSFFAYSVSRLQLYMAGHDTIGSQKRP